MRSRNIKPGFYHDEELADLPRDARFIFPGLWLMADCEGRLEDRPRRIKAELLPYDDDVSVGRVHELLQLLADAGFIQRYEVGTERFIQVVNFLKHQNPHVKERKAGSQIPSNQCFYKVPDQTGAGLVLVPEIPVPVPVQTGASPADSGFLIPDSLSPEKVQKPQKQPRFADTASEQDIATREASERMYGLHPKKKNLPLVVPALADAVARAPDWRTAIADIEACHAAWCAHSEWLGNNGKFVPKLPDWISDRGYTRWPPGHARNQPARKLNIYTPPTMPTEEPDDPRTSPVQH